MAAAAVGAGHGLPSLRGCDLDPALEGEADNTDPHKFDGWAVHVEHDGGAAVCAGAPTTFTTHARYADGASVVTRAGLAFTVVLDGPALLRGDADVEGRDGHYAVTLRVHDAGVYTVRAEMEWAYCEGAQRCHLESTRADINRPRLRPRDMHYLLVRDCSGEGGGAGDWDAALPAPAPPPQQGARWVDVKSPLCTDAEICSAARGGYAWLPFNRTARRFSFESRADFACLCGRWLHMAGDSLTEGAFERLAADMDRAMCMTRVFTSSYFGEPVHGSDDKRLRLVVATGPGADACPLYLSFSWFHKRSKDLREREDAHHATYLSHLFDPLLPYTGGRTAPDALVFNIGLHNVGARFDQHAELVDEALAAVRASYDGPLIWRNTARTQFPEGTLHPLFTCRGWPRVQRVDEVAAALLTRHNISATVDFYTVTAPRENMASDNRHYRGAGGVVYSAGSREMLNTVCSLWPPPPPLPPPCAPPWCWRPLRCTAPAASTPVRAAAAALVTAFTAALAMVMVALAGGRRAARWLAARQGRKEAHYQVVPAQDDTIN